MNELADKIRAMAADGYGKTMTYELLGIGRYRFETILKAIGPVEFTSPNATRGARASYRARRGIYFDAMRQASAKAGRVRKEQARRTVRGVRGTIDELVEAFRCPVTASQVRRRLCAGMTLEEALFTPKATRNNLGRWVGVTPDRRREILARLEKEAEQA